ncbi:MBL fold metallo-hydrolase [Sesbania bispinosa]|nr:MBL fold metallo-hydrolase [Sesbania bispinosa]
MAISQDMQRGFNLVHTKRTICTGDQMSISSSAVSHQTSFQDFPQKALVPVRNVALPDTSPNSMSRSLYMTSSKVISRFCRKGAIISRKPNNSIFPSIQHRGNSTPDLI